MGEAGGAVVGEAGGAIGANTVAILSKIVGAIANYYLIILVLQAIGWIIGLFLGVITSILIFVAEYNNFIANPAVVLGWPLVVNICNMFFILIFLVIAFATVLRIETYNWKKALPKLLIMAVLINFSKTICGLLIDFSQVIMLTFVDAFAKTGAYNIFNMFGIEKVFSFYKSPEFLNVFKGSLHPLTMLGSLIFGLILLIIASVFVIIYTVILTFRIVMLWILIILSPLAFLSSAFSAGQRYASQWWGEFVNYLIIGPVMAFFLWLSLAVVGGGKLNNEINKIKQQAVGTQASDQLYVGLTQAGSVDNILKFIISASMLIGGLLVAQQLGVAGSSMAGAAVGRMRSIGISATTTPLKAGLFKAGRSLDNAQMAAQRWFLQKTRFGRLMTGESKREKLERNMNKELEKLKQEEQLKEISKHKDNLKKRLEKGLLTKKQYAEKIKPYEEKEKIIMDKEHEIRKKYAYKPGIVRKMLTSLSKTGVSGNYRMWIEGYKNFRGRRLHDYETGKSGKIHDLLSLATSLGKEETDSIATENMMRVGEYIKEIKDKSMGETDLVLKEFFKAIDAKDAHRTVASLISLVQSNDINEPAKGHYLREKLMPMVEKMLEKKYLGKKVKAIDENGNEVEKMFEKEDIQDMLKYWTKKGSVSPGFIKFFTNNVLTDLYKGDEDQAAKMSKIVTQTALSSGSYWASGAESYNIDKNQFEFSPINLRVERDEQGKEHFFLDIDDTNKEYISAKLKNFDFRRVLQKMHPGVLGNEDEFGNIAGLNELNKFILLKNLDGKWIRSLNERPHEWRTDTLLKTSSSNKWNEDVNKLADDLQKDINNGLIKYRKFFKTKQQARDQVELIKSLPLAMKRAAKGVKFEKPVISTEEE